MKSSTFATMKASLKAYYTEYYDLYNGKELDISNNNLVLQNALENFNDLVAYNNTITEGHILNDFKDHYGDMQLKDSSVKKLLEWLNEENIIFTFEHDLVIDKGSDYYMSKNAFMMYTQEESHEPLDYWLQGEKLTDRQKDTIESDLSSVISKGQEYLYIHSVSIEFTLPKSAILREYADYRRRQR